MSPAILLLALSPAAPLPMEAEYTPQEQLAIWVSGDLPNRRYEATYYGGTPGWPWCVSLTDHHQGVYVSGYGWDRAGASRAAMAELRAAPKRFPLPLP